MIGYSSNFDPALWGFLLNMKLYENPNPLNVKIPSDEEVKLRAELEEKNDAESTRLRRFLALPDLSRTEGNPIQELVRRILEIDELSNFDQVTSPEILRADVSFDLFNFPPDHPARKGSDTYFVDREHILRTHTTIMWYYYLQLPEVREKMKRREYLGLLSYGKVYRKDEIDRFHLNVFHQMDGFYLVPSEEKTLAENDLKNILVKIAEAVFGKGTQCRFNLDQFPYTDPSIEMEVERNGMWVEVLGGGMARPVVLGNLGVKGYNGWAFGFGLERLAVVSMELPDIRLLRSEDPRVKKQLVLGNTFKEVSKYPPVTRDISFVVKNDFIPNQYFDLIRDIGGDLVEEVQLLDKYEDAVKFGADRMSYTYRVVYRSSDRTLTSEEVDAIQKKLYDETAKQFAAELR